MSKKNKKNKGEDQIEDKVVDQQTEQSTATDESTETVEENLKEENIENELQAKIDELNNKYLRLYSEFDNYRKRTAKEKIELIATASEGVMKELLSTIDDFERAIAHNENSTDAAAIKEGFQLIYNKFVRTLESKGLKGMDSKGADFDTELHEAVTNFPVEDPKQKGKVFDVVEKGYFLNDKVLRHAKVVVGQ